MRKFLLTAAVLGAPLSALAQPVQGPYVSLGAGVGLQQDLIANPTPSIGRDHANFWSFDPGFSGQASVGYGIGWGLRTEIEGDFLSNSVDRYFPAAGPREAGGTEYKYGGMANLLYDIDVGLPVFPYVGVGVGGQIVEQDHFHQAPPGFVFPPGVVSSESVGAFAYQAIAGVAFPLTVVPGLSLTLEYRFLGSDYSNAGFARTEAQDLPAPTVVGYGKTTFHNDFNHSILIGLRYVLFPPAPPPPAAPVPVAAPAPAPARTYLVFFDWDRADLTARARQVIAAAAQASAHVQLTRIAVNGYTDTSGTPAYNQQLSVRRAQSVAAELVRDGVPASEIAVQGFGETHPLVPTAAGVREPQNRRVQIIFH